MIIYKIYLWNAHSIPEKYINNITKYEHLLDNDYNNWHNLPTEGLIQNNAYMFEQQRQSRQYNYILAIDTNIDDVVGTLVFTIQKPNLPLSYFDSIAKKNIFFAYFYIDEQYRNLGIGTTMLNVLSEYIRNRGNGIALQMKVDIPNRNAQRFYLRLGYKPIFSELHLNTFDTNVMPAHECEPNSYVMDRIRDSISNKLSFFDNNLTLDQMLRHINYRFNSNELKCATSNNNYILYNTNGYGFNNIDDIFTNSDDTNDLIAYNKIIRAFNALCNNNGISRMIIEVPYKDVPFYKKLNFYEAINNMIKEV